MNKFIASFLICLCTFGIVRADDNSETVEWVIYLAAGPDAALVVSQGDNDIVKYEYPKYIGYLYTRDSKTIEWHTDVPYAKKFMQRLANKLREYGLYYFTEHPAPLLKEDNRDFWRLNDPAFFDAAVQLIPEYNYLRPIRFERNARIDKEWRPVFPVQVRIEGPVDDEKGQVTEAVMAAEKKIQYNDYKPLNWDWSKNSHYIPPSQRK